MSKKKALIGLEDLALGMGTRKVPTFGGKMVEVTEINFHNLPFDENTSLAEKIKEVEVLLQNGDVHLLAKHTNDIKNIASVLDKLLDMASLKSDVYRDIHNNMKFLRMITDNMKSLYKVLEEADSIRDTAKKLSWLKCECDRLYTKNRKLDTANRKLVQENLLPAIEKMDKTKSFLENLMAVSKDEIQKGHDIAKKFQTYNWQLKAVPPCGKLEFHIDDAHAAIVLQVPVATKPGDCNCDDIDKTKKFVLPRVIVDDGQSVFPANNVTAVDRLYTTNNKVDPNSIAKLEDDGFIHLYKLDKTLNQLVPYTGLKKGDPLEFYISQDPAMAAGGVEVLDVWGDKSATKVVSARLTNILKEWLDALHKLTGLPELSEDLGIFAQEDDEVIIPDNSTIKEAFQAIEKYLDKIPKTYLELPDTIATYAAQALKIMRVNAAEDAVEAVELVASIVKYDDTVSKLGMPPADLNVQKAIERLKNLVDAMPEQVTVGTIAERDALVPAPNPNTIVHVADASADNTVDSGWAKYQLIGGVWHKYISLDDLTHFMDHTRATILDKDELKPGGISGKEFMGAMWDLHLGGGVFLEKTRSTLTKDKPTALEVQAILDNFKDPDSNYAPRNKILYYNNTDVFNDGDAMTKVYYVTKDGKVFDLSASGEPTVFAPDNTLNPGVAGEPTASEIQAFVAPKVNVMVTYNGKDAIGDERSRSVWWVDDSGVATLVDRWNITDMAKYVTALGMINEGVHIQQRGDTKVNLIGGNLLEYDDLTNSIKTYTIPSNAPQTFDIMTPDGNIVSAGATDVPMTQYWDGANMVVLPDNNDAVFHSFFVNRTGNTILLVGDVKYATFAAGTRLYGGELANVPNQLDNYIYIGGLLSRKDASTTNNPRRTMLVNASKIGEIRISGSSADTGLLKTPVATTVGVVNSLLAIEAPTNGERRQILDFLPALVYYTYSTTDASGLRPNDGSAGSWLSRTMLDATTPVIDPLVGMLIYGPAGKLEGDGFLAVEENKRVVGGKTSYPQAIASHPYWVDGDDILFSSLGGIFLRNVGGKASNIGAIIEEKQQLVLNCSTYDGQMGRGGSGIANGFGNPQNWKTIKGDGENAPKAMAQQLYLITDLYAGYKVKTVDLAGTVPLPAGADDYVIRKDAAGNVSAVPISSADYTTSEDQCIDVFTSVGGVQLPRVGTPADQLIELDFGVDLTAVGGELAFVVSDLSGTGRVSRTLKVRLPLTIDQDDDFLFVGPISLGITGVYASLNRGAGNNPNNQKLGLWIYSTQESNYGNALLHSAVWCKTQKRIAPPGSTPYPLVAGDYEVVVAANGDVSFKSVHTVDTEDRAAWLDNSLLKYDKAADQLVPTTITPPTALADVDSGYYEMGNVLVQWGRVHKWHSDWGRTVVVYDRPYKADTMPNVSFTISENAQGKMDITGANFNNTGFAYFTYLLQGGVGNSDVFWIATGMKP